MVRYVNFILASVVALLVVAPVQAERAFYSAYSIIANGTFSTLVFTSTSSTVLGNTADGADNQSLRIDAGGGTGTTRGAEVQLYGNEHANTGRASISSGSATPADITLTSTIDLRTNGGTSRMTIASSGSLGLERTNTAGGTTGAQTINKMAGSVNFAAAATSLVVTNSQVSATSNVFCSVQTNDATFTSIKSCVPGSGSFTINANAAATAETRVAFWVTN